MRFDLLGLLFFLQIRPIPNRNPAAFEINFVTKPASVLTGNNEYGTVPYRTTYNMEGTVQIPIYMPARKTRGQQIVPNTKWRDSQGTVPHD